MPVWWILALVCIIVAVVWLRHRQRLQQQRAPWQRLAVLVEAAAKQPQQEAARAMAQEVKIRLLQLHGRENVAPMPAHEAYASLCQVLGQPASSDVQAWLAAALYRHDAPCASEKLCQDLAQFAAALKDGNIVAGRKP